jgi:hypothetical protein
MHSTHSAKKAVLRPGERDGALSGRVVGKLGVAEQFVVWALRETASNDPRSAERLDRGFRLAFGSCAHGLAACGFDGMRRCLAVAERPPALCPLHCACLAIDEELLLAGLGAAQRGNRPLHASLSRRFVGECGAQSLWRQSRILGAAMADVRLILPEGPKLTAQSASARH